MLDYTYFNRLNYPVKAETCTFEFLFYLAKLLYSILSFTDFLLSVWLSYKKYNHDLYKYMKSYIKHVNLYIIMCINIQWEWLEITFIYMMNGC